MFDFSQLKLPIIQAPMAGGINTPALAAAVIHAGGVGGFGFAYSTPQKIGDDLVATKKLLGHSVNEIASNCINANFFVFSPVALPSEIEQIQAVAALNRLPFNTEGHDCDVIIPRPPFFPDLEEQLEPIWEHRPAILTFHFGIPHVRVIEKARALGIFVGITATNVLEARAIQDAGADFIVAQGIEAGGHRGIFDPDGEDDRLATLELTQRLKQRTNLPIVAAGGLMHGRDIYQVLQAGASAAQLGTAFLCCTEAGTTISQQDYLQHYPERGTVLTRAFSGRMARGVRNQFIELMDGQAVLPFPIQNTMTAPLRQLAIKSGDGEYQSLWAGAHYAQVRNMPAADLMEVLAQEMRAQIP